MRPPAVPQFSYIFSCRSFEYAEIGRFEKTSQAEQHRLRVIALFVQKLQRQSLRDQREGQLVFLIAKRSCQVLKERFVAAVILDLVANPIRFLL